VVQDSRGQVSGVIERVATGTKETFTGLEVIGQVIHTMRQGSAPPRADAGAPPDVAGAGKH
jgi:hypothetical protein